MKMGRPTRLMKGASLRACACWLAVGAASLARGPLIAQPSPIAQGSAPENAAASKPASAEARKPISTARAVRVMTRTSIPESAKRFYEAAWGVQILGVKAVESGSMLRFSYTVLDAEKAQVLNDKKQTPFLYDLNSKVRLEVPSMEKVGQLRQSSPVQAGHTYWMVFANQQRIVKPGSRVDVSIGPFRAQGLLVE